MSRFACERCGGDGTVTVGHRAPEGRPQPFPALHHYCRACAKQVGVPLLDRKALPPDIADRLAIWSELETVLTHIDRDVQTSRAAGGIAADAAAHLLRAYPELPGPMPTRIRDAFARVGIPLTSADR
jgi:hypothetical protein